VNTDERYRALRDADERYRALRDEGYRPDEVRGILVAERTENAVLDIIGERRLTDAEKNRLRNARSYLNDAAAALSLRLDP